MANQCAQLIKLLTQEGARVELVRTNAPYRPAWVERVRLLRALFRLVPYVLALRQAIVRADVVHVLANSGWSWYLFAWPALLLCRWSGVGAIVNYRGGHADSFLGSAPSHVKRALAGAALRITPSMFLVRVFRRHGLDAQVIPNIIDLARFTPRPARTAGAGPHLVVTRNLEVIYDIGTAIRAFAEIRKVHPDARLTVAGTGPERDALQQLADAEGLSDAVKFSGRIDNQVIGALYQDADCLLNPSTVDNMPISILEAMASGVPVVSTDAGGIPDMVDNGATGLLVPVGDHRAMAVAALRVLGEPDFSAAMSAAALVQVRQYAWPEIREQWRQAYWQVGMKRRKP